MLDRAYFEKRAKLVKEAVTDYRQRVGDLELQLCGRLGTEKHICKSQVIIQLQEERQTLRWIEGRHDEIRQALYVLDKKEGK